MTTLNSLYRSIPLALLGFTVALMWNASSHAGVQATFTTIDVPGALVTNARGINTQGVIVGVYQDVAGIVHGFRLASGHFQTIDFPGASSTIAQGINDRDVIVGQYGLNSTDHGFRLIDGTFTSVDYPGATATTALGINRAGVIVGIMQIFPAGQQGYRWTEGSGYSSLGGLLAYGLNDRGVIVGANASGGFRLAGSELTTINPPNSNGGVALDINNSGVIVGAYSDLNFAIHGFLFVAGNYMTVDFPGAIQTVVWGISDNDVIVGQYFDANGVSHGFRANLG